MRGVGNGVTPAQIGLTAKLGDRFYKQLLGPLDRSPEVTLNNRGWMGNEQGRDTGELGGH
jgi:hypothetical protein